MSEIVIADLLGRNIKVLSGFAFPSEGFNQLTGLPLIRIRDLASSDTEVRFKGRYDPAYLIKKGDVLIGMDGDFEVHRWTGDVALLNQRVCKVEAVTREVDQRFLYWYLKPRVAEIHRRTPQTTVRHLSASDLYLITKPPISPDEQAVVSQVLDTLDTAIQETEAIIAKLKAVKQGLLHDLLIRGIDANGELRPPQAEAPHLYKLSKLGWVPRDWDIVRIGEDTDIEHGFAFPGHQFTDKEVGPALLVPGNFHREGGLYFTTENTKYFSGKYLQEYMLSRGDVLVVMTDLSPMTLILGRTVVLTEEFDVLHNQRIGKFRFRKDGLWDPKFFAETLSQDAVRMKVIAEATGTTVRHTSPDRIKSCYVARPKLEEQQLASQRITVVESRRKLEEAKLLKLKQTKSALMDDLLTGRVRVTPLLNTNNEQGAS